MKERIGFVNGSMSVVSGQGTTITLNVPTVVKPAEPLERGDTV
jgi:signal transduction histidine kinase